MKKKEDYNFLQYIEQKKKELKMRGRKKENSSLKQKKKIIENFRIEIFFKIFSKFNNKKVKKKMVIILKKIF